MEPSWLSASRDAFAGERDPDFADPRHARVHLALAFLIGAVCAGMFLGFLWVLG